MKANLTGYGCTLIRESEDKRIAKESTVGYHMRKLLNSQGYSFVRLNPSKHGLTSCTVGMFDRKNGILLWHERYQVEDAAQAFNQGNVFFQRVFINVPAVNSK